MQKKLHIKTNNKQVNTSIQIAFNDIYGNIKQLKSPLDQKQKKVLIAGADYDRPWTRDTSINIYNGFCLMDKEIAKNTLLSVLENINGQIYIGGQYWDAIIWALGAYQYYLVTKDKDFLVTAYRAIKNTLKDRETNEYTKEYGLFRGPAVYGDGVAAYPLIYGYAGKFSSILYYPKFNKDKCYKEGFGIPMHTLSTNIVYLLAYRIIIQIAQILDSSDNVNTYQDKETKLINAIKKHFIYANERLKYIVGKLGDCIRQEGLGIAFASMANIVGKEAFNNLYISNSGIPCLFPNFSRYNIGTEYGRQSGTVWPHVQGFFAIEALKRKKYSMFEFEFNKLTEFSNRDKQFYEVFHPDTGKVDGGIQEHRTVEGVKKYKSCEHQTWSATAYLSMILYGFVGIEITQDKISFKPYLNDLINNIQIDNLNIVKANINLKIRGKGNNIKSFQVNNQEINSNIIDSDLEGDVEISIIME